MSAAVPKLKPISPPPKLEFEVIGRDEKGRSQYFPSVYPDYIRRNSRGIVCAICRGEDGEEFEVAYECPRTGVWIWTNQIAAKDWSNK
jgi:hypothetical protein